MIWINKDGIIANGKLITYPISEESMKESMDKILLENEKSSRRARRRIWITSIVFLLGSVYLLFILWEAWS